MTLSKGSSPEKVVVGVTGGIGSGKTLACSFFSDCGAYVINCDSVYRRLALRSGKMKNEIFSYFGADVFDSQFNIISSRMSEIVFSDSEKLEALNRITHKYVFRHIQKTVQLCNSRLVFVESAILFDCGLNKMCRFTVMLLSDDDLRAERAASRQNLSVRDVKLRMKSQRFHDFIANADFVIINNGTAEELESKVRSVYLSIVSACGF